MILASFTNELTGRSSHLIGDSARGIAVVIDPAREVGPYLRAAEERGLRIGHAIATHQRALLTPLYELKKRVGALIHSRASGPPLFSINALMPGSSFTLGRYRFHIPIDRSRAESLHVYDLESDSTAPFLVTTDDWPREQPA